jgi:hyperosmotically inducible protein
MNTQSGQRLMAVAFASVMAITLAACSKTVDTAATPAPSTTVGTKVDDTVITTLVKAGLADSMDVKSFDFKVETRKGEVLLSGFVDNQSQIDRAVAVAQAVAGVISVDNKVSLKGGSTTVGTKIDDGLITTRVKAALLADASVSSADIAVVTRNGEVQLSGFVNNQGQIDRAMALAKGTGGVTSVTNETKLKN